MKYYDLLTSHSLSSFAKSPPAVVVQVNKINRDKLTFVKGGSLEMNRKIVRSKPDALLDAFDSGHMTVDSAIVQVAKDNDVSFAISLSQFLEASPYKRVRLLVNYRKLIKLCIKRKARFFFVSHAKDEYGARPPMQLIAFAQLFDLTLRQAKWAISQVPEYLISKRGGP